MPAVRENSVDQAKPMITSDSDRTASSATNQTTCTRREARVSSRVRGKAIATQTTATISASPMEKPSTPPKKGVRNRE